MKHDFSEESFTPQEDELIIRLHATIGSRYFEMFFKMPFNDTPSLTLDCFTSSVPQLKRSQISSATQFLLFSLCV